MSQENMSLGNDSLRTAAMMARVAGLAYVVYIFAGFYMVFGPIPSLSVFAGESASTAGPQLMFRTGLVAEAIMYTFVGVASASLYLTLRPVSLAVSTVAAFCRVIEASMGGAFILMKYAAFAAVSNTQLLVALSNGERGALMGFLAHLYSNAVFFLIFPMAVGGVLFFNLFYRSRFIPRWLAAWGMLTYGILGCVAATIILFPDLQDYVRLFFLPGALFEVVVGFWLLFVGIKTRHWEAANGYESATS